MELARRHLGSRSQRGLEIGASSINRFDGVAAWNLDHPDGALFQAAQERIAGEAVAVDVYAAGDVLPFADRSLDFVLTSHVLEHMPDTIRCLREWSRVVRDGGIVFAIVPHAERTFDAPRPRTELEHHLADYALGMTIEQSPLVPTSHYHVWTTDHVVRLIGALNLHGCLDWTIVDVEDVDSKVGNGFTVVARKRSQPELAAPAAGGPAAFHFLTLALPFQVAMRTTEHVVHGSELRVPAGLPRGVYRAVPVSAGFPPTAGPAVEVAVGPTVEPPILDSVARDGGTLRFAGRHLTETTYLEADFGDLAPLRRALPAWRDGELVLDISRLALPPRPFSVAAVNLPPGGGRGPARELREHLD